MSPQSPGSPVGSEPAGGSVVIAMLTYRRAEVVDAIAAVLEQMQALPGREAGRSAPDIRLLVIDNDPEGGAQALMGRFARSPVHYVHEPRPGIAAARNRALDEASDARTLIFIDDDERPRAGWLERMLATHDEHGGAGVVGAVVSEFDRDPDEWISAGRFFDRRRLPTGTPVQVAATNNLLLDLDLVRRSGVRFDERFGSSGGSDTLFTRLLVQQGAALIWCDEAVVVDRVPASRLTHRWVLRRAFRSGNSWSQTSLVLAGSPVGRLRVRLQALAAGVLRLAGGLAGWTAGALGRSLPLRVRGLRTVARGAGMVAGAAGYRFHEYRPQSTPAAVGSPAVERLRA